VRLGDLTLCGQNQILAPFSRWALPIADVFIPVGELNLSFTLNVLSLKGKNMPAQGNALRQQDRLRILSGLTPVS
jgi:hypothetical protein